MKKYVRKKIINRTPKFFDKRRKSPNRAYQFHICMWIALRKSIPQILALLEDRFNITMSYHGVDRYRYGKRWKAIISYFRNKYLTNISRIPIASKAYRLQMLQEALEEALTWHTKSISQWGRVEEKKIGVIPALIERARIEVEGEKPLVNVGVQVMVGADLITKIKEIENAQVRSESDRRLDE